MKKAKEDYHIASFTELIGRCGGGLGGGGAASLKVK